MLGAILFSGIGFMVLERLRPARPMPKVSMWWPRALLFNSLQMGVVVLAGVTWDHWLSRVSLFTMPASIHPMLAGAIGYLVLTFVYYWWHRARHQSNILWRWCHQLHHSPARLETITSFYKHPVELIANSILSGAIIYTTLGLSLEAAAWATAFCAVAEFFYHVNIRTPHWVGWFIQRPEMHRIHHERGVHESNYGDLPIWDMLFGTYENPIVREVECGFEPSQELAVFDMILARDMHHE